MLAKGSAAGRERAAISDADDEYELQLDPDQPPVPQSDPAPTASGEPESDSSASGLSFLERGLFARHLCPVCPSGSNLAPSGGRLSDGEAVYCCPPRRTVTKQQGTKWIVRTITATKPFSVAIQGSLFFDVNGNDDYNPGTDQPMANVNITLKRSSGGARAGGGVVLARTTTSSTGAYKFVLSARYPSETMDIRLAKTDALVGRVKTNSAGGAVAERAAVAAAVIDGSVWYDNGDGEYDPESDKPLAKSYIDVKFPDGSLLKRASTDGNGAFSFYVNQYARQKFVVFDSAGKSLGSFTTDGRGAASVDIPIQGVITSTRTQTPTPTPEPTQPTESPTMSISTEESLTPTVTVVVETTSRVVPTTQKKLTSSRPRPTTSRVPVIATTRQIVRTTPAPIIPTTRPVIRTTRVFVPTSGRPIPTTRAPIKTTSPIIRTTSPVIRTTSPVIRTTSPVIRTTSPVIRTTSPVIRTTSPIIRTTSPLVQTTSPVVRTTSPIIRTTSPIIRTTSPIIRTTSPVIRTTSPIVRTTSPIIRTTSPIIRTTSPIVRTTPKPVVKTTSPGYVTRTVSPTLNAKNRIMKAGCTYLPVPYVLPKATDTQSTVFNIELISCVADASVNQVFVKAAQRWQSIIVGDLLDVVSTRVALPITDCITDSRNAPMLSCGEVDDLIIGFEVFAIDGVGNTLAQAFPTYSRPTNYAGGPNLPMTGYMIFDAYDWVDMEQKGTLQTVVTHEMGHVLGFGSKWLEFSLLSPPNCQSLSPPFTATFGGVNAKAALSVIGYSGSTVPVEDTGGQGTACGHWKETIMKTELVGCFVVDFLLPTW